MQKLYDLLSQASNMIGITLTKKQQHQLIQYAMYLEKWNKTYNLTAVLQLEEIIKRHVIDSLAIVPHIRTLSPKTLADVGSGAGIPGVILAIAQPQLQVDLIESIGKKCRFLHHVIINLSLTKQVNIHKIRVENWQVQNHRCIIICRAFSSLTNFMTITRHLGNQQSYWLAMKSAYTTNEEKELPATIKLIKNHRLIVPFTIAPRNLLILKY